MGLASQEPCTGEHSTRSSSLWYAVLLCTKGLKAKLLLILIWEDFSLAQHQAIHWNSQQTKFVVRSNKRVYTHLPATPELDSSKSHTGEQLSTRQLVKAKY